MACQTRWKALPWDDGSGDAGESREKSGNRKVYGKQRLGLSFSASWSLPIPRCPICIQPQVFKHVNRASEANCSEVKTRKKVLNKEGCGNKAK